MNSVTPCFFGIIPCLIQWSKVASYCSKNLQTYHYLIHHKVEVYFVTPSCGNMSGLMVFLPNVCNASIENLCLCLISLSVVCAEFNMKYIQENGLLNPIVFYDKTGLGLR